MDIVHITGIKNQTADALLQVHTNRNNRTPFDDNLRVLTIVSKCNGQIELSRNENNASSDLEEVKKKFSFFIPEIFKLSRRQVDGLQKNLSIREILEAQTSVKEFYHSTDAVGMSKSKSTVGEHGKLVKSSHLDGAVRRYVQNNYLSTFPTYITTLRYLDT